MKNQIVKGNIILAILATALMAFAIQGISYGAVTVSVAPDNASPAAGDTLMVSINIAGGKNVGGYQFNLTFDPAVLTFDSIENADYLPAGAFAVPPNTDEEGKVGFAATAIGVSSDGDGTLAKAMFTVKTADMTSIGLEGVLISDSGGTSIADVTAMGAEINAPTPDPDGEMPDPDGETPDPDGEMPDPDGEMPDPDGEMPDPDGEMPKMSTFMMHLYPGLNMISLPLKPEMPFTARSLAMHLGATTVIMLDGDMQQFVGFTPDAMDDGFEIKGGMGYIVNVPDGGYAKFTGMAWGEPMADAMPDMGDMTAAPGGTAIRADAWAFVVSGHPLDMKRGVTYTVVTKNLSRGTVATHSVSRKSSGHYATVWADLGRKSVVKAGDLLEITMVDQHGNIVSGPFQRVVSVSNIRDAYLSVTLRVGDVHPNKTTLAQNFPNPFNPETWLPFQLSESASVTFRIYDRAGRLVRTFPLGFRPAGFYTTRSSAVYWDGRSNTGEKVASGLYFYTMQTNKNFTETRRMLIVK